MLKKMLFGLVALGLGGSIGCRVYGPAVVAPGLVVAPVPFLFGGFYPYHRYGYYGYYGGFRHSYWRR